MHGPEAIADRDAHDPPSRSVPDLTREQAKAPGVGVLGSAKSLFGNLGSFVSRPVFRNRRAVAEARVQAHLDHALAL